MRKFGAALALGVLLVTAGCGSSRPSVDEVSAALQKGGKDSVLGEAGANLKEKAADCMAEALVDSKISDEALQALVDGDKKYKGSTADSKAAEAISAKMVKCISEDLAK